MNFNAKVTAFSSWIGCSRNRFANLDAENLAKYVYRLTEKGLGLVPAILSMIDWSVKYDKKTEVPKSYSKEYRKNRIKFEKKIRATAMID